MADSKNIDDGGYAFPNGPDHKSGWDAEYGMSLRDYFAGQAIGTVISQCAADSDVARYAGGPPVYFAKKAYEIADAMIAVRKAGGRS